MFFSNNKQSTATKEYQNQLLLAQATEQLAQSRCTLLEKVGSVLSIEELALSSIELERIAYSMTTLKIKLYRLNDKFNFVCNNGVATINLKQD